MRPNHHIESHISTDALTPNILDHILQNLPESEHLEMIGLLGNSLVQEIQELRQEAQMLAEITQDYRTETQEMIEQQQKTSDTLLSQPSFQWNALNQRINLLMDCLEQNGETTDLVSDSESHILDYVRIKTQPRSLSRLQAGISNRTQNNVLIRLLDGLGIGVN
ncbi:hypothetical protein BCR33DRAFT_38325 [Rhizoclosmatium globosum]|uniref:Uncharacterized protein n=1 Tax=Rhizoclosmatium globosum TaxID=329046 RepID=A0A1Y2CNE1_9FUNG|nr:hypothetical protein BCR33DRAFT_38325 [Rhizoclosmatium globosum]|eukprot:ORY48551.1 hypothetical protein BCR33DRAFT_38325 [Rhizoclosmatium globosum]